MIVKPGVLVEGKFNLRKEKKPVLDKRVEDALEKFWTLQFKAEDAIKNVKKDSPDNNGDANAFTSAREASNAMELVRQALQVYKTATDIKSKVYGANIKDKGVMRILLRAKRDALSLIVFYQNQKRDENHASFERTGREVFKKQANEWWRRVQQTHNEKVAVRYEEMYNEKYGGVPRTKDELMDFMKQNGFNKF